MLNPKPTSFLRSYLEQLLRQVDVAIDGDRPFDIQVHDDRFYRHFLSSVGIGESYVEQWWSCSQPDELINRLAKMDINLSLLFNVGAANVAKLLSLTNFQSKKHAKANISFHYDLGNDLFSTMLGQTLCYSCGYFKNATTLDDAQIAKMDLICKKLKLKPGMRVLDIGCGWGSFAKYASETFGVSVVGITISQEQAQFAANHCKGLPVEIRFQDYRDIKEEFDCIVSIGMFEHVGLKNYETFFRSVQNNLRPGGLFLLHTMGSDMPTPPNKEYWLTKYIFPAGYLPSMAQVTQAADIKFLIQDWHSFGHYYDQTLLAWHANFTNAWPRLSQTYDDRFFRIWTFYLLSCAGMFRTGVFQLWQIVFSKDNLPSVYEAVR